MKILAIDWGSRRVGLAIADQKARIATPLAVLANNDDLVSNLKNMANQEAVAQIVVGLPRNLEGEETAQSVQVRRFAADLSQKLKIPVALQDESLTSVTAQSGGANKTMLDSQAAVIILSDYLGV